MAKVAATRALVHGRVQGVFFRAFVLEKALGLGLTGYVQNLPDGSVEVWAEGEKGKLEALIGYLQTGPPLARVGSVKIAWSRSTGKHHNFSIKYA